MFLLHTHSLLLYITLNAAGFDWKKWNWISNICINGTKYLDTIRATYITCMRINTFEIQINEQYVHLCQNLQINLCFKHHWHFEHLSSIVWHDQAKCAYTNLPCHVIYRNYCNFKHLFIFYYWASIVASKWLSQSIENIIAKYRNWTGIVGICAEGNSHGIFLM